MQNFLMTKPITAEFIAELEMELDSIKLKQNPLRSQNGRAVMDQQHVRPNIQTAEQLRTKTFPALKYIVPTLVTEGLTLLAGRPKARKSWLALDIGLCTASGCICLGNLKCQQGEVLYLALEDGERRLQRRMTKLLPIFGAEWPERFMYETKWPRADQGGIEAIDKWCGEHPDARLVVIDVLARFRAPSNSRTNAYEYDYQAICNLQALAIRRAIAIIIVHHTRKGAGEDPVDEISGTLGLAGGADAFLVLKRDSSGAVLTGRGRDLEDVELAVQFGDATCRWTILGEAAEIRRSAERASVLAALKEAGDALPISEIMSLANLVSRNAADNLLMRMAKGGDVVRLKRGLYGLAEHPAVKKMREMREKERSEPKTNKKQESSKPANLTQGETQSEIVRNDLTISRSGERHRERPNPLNEQRDYVKSHDLTHLTQVFEGKDSELRAGLATTPDYLGPPGDDPADFLGDIPDFLRRI
jgi:hypothetical protein